MDGKLRYRSGLAVLAGSLVALLVSGCLTPYCIPKIERTPALKLPESEPGARAFRIDETSYYSARPWRGLPDKCELEIRGIPIDQAAYLAAQTDVRVERGLGLTGILLLHDGKHVRHSMSILIYRPGYKTVEWSGGEPFEWIKAKDFPEQVSDLTRLCSIALKPIRMPVSAEHRKVLEFLASECDRLATSIESTPVEEQFRHEQVNSQTDNLVVVPIPGLPNPQIAYLRGIRDDLRELAIAVTVPPPKVAIPIGQGSQVAGAELKKQLEIAGRKGLPVLMNHPDTTLALAAAWEHYIGPGTKDVTPQPKEFVKFFEVRTGAKVPLRWEYCIVMDGLNNSPDSDALIALAQKEYLPKCDFLIRSDQKLTGREIKYCPQPRVETQMGFYSPQDLHVERKDNKIVLTSGVATVTVQDPKFDEEIKHPHEFCAVHFGPRRTFIAMYGMSGGAFPLFCVDSQTGNMDWQAELWAWGHHVTLGGWMPDPDIMFAEAGNQIFVFGKSGGSYVEAFDIENGNPTLRFTPDHWWPNDSGLLARWRRNLRR